MDSLGALAKPVANLLADRNETVAVVESSAGGLLSSVLLAVPGASRYFRGGAVVYTQHAREGLLALTASDMEGIRSASEPYALLLARRIRERLGASWGVGETGAAGPTGNRHGDAAGHTCIAVTGPVERVLTIETGRSEREANMWAFVAKALALLEECLRSTG